MCDVFVSFFRNKNYEDAIEMYSKAIYYCPLDDDHKEQMVQRVHMYSTVNAPH